MAIKIDTVYARQSDKDPWLVVHDGKMVNKNQFKISAGNTWSVIVISNTDTYVWLSTGSFASCVQ